MKSQRSRSIHRRIGPMLLLTVHRARATWPSFKTNDHWMASLYRRSGVNCLNWECLAALIVELLQLDGRIALTWTVPKLHGASVAGTISGSNSSGGVTANWLARGQVVSLPTGTSLQDRVNSAAPPGATVTRAGPGRLVKKSPPRTTWVGKGLFRASRIWAPTKPKNVQGTDRLLTN